MSESTDLESLEFCKKIKDVVLTKFKKTIKLLLASLTLNHFSSIEKTSITLVFSKSNDSLGFF
jgi:hypothetical protein